jgi:CRISPR-associated protein Cmr5
MSNEHTVQTLDQRRAAHAWGVVEQVMRLPEGDQDEFGTQAKKLPTRILAAGLGQALAFLEAKNAARPLREALAEWMDQRRPAAGERRLVVRVIHGDADFLRFATAECLAYLQWLVRFADAQRLTRKTQE